VVHPCKTVSVSDSDEVGGLGSITNIACNVFCLQKLEKADVGYRRKGDDGKQEIVRYNSILKILKNRSTGETGEIGLQYDKDIRRFTEFGHMPKEYSWFKGLEHRETVDEIPEM